MKNNKTILLFSTTLIALAMILTGCGGRESPALKNAAADILAQDADSTGKLTIARVDELMNSAQNMATSGPSFDASVEALETNATFKKTPMGAYLENWLPGLSNVEQIDEASSKIINYLVKTDTCSGGCTPEFLKEVADNKEGVVSRLQEVSKGIAENEIRNHEKFTMFYWAFANEMRLYQDVLRVVKSFEYLTKLNTTYPFRDFAFKDARVTLEDFLKDWWQEYLDHTKKENLSPFPTEGQPALGQHVGLTLFPDSISYAQQHVFSTNVNFLGNNLSPKNSSVFYFLNSTSATASHAELAQTLMQITLAPYIRDEKGEFDQAKFDKIVANLKEIFDRAMSKSGGQTAQILVDNSAAPEVSYMAWNGGEPMWISKNDQKVIMAKDSDGKTTFMPPNVFWPTTEEQKAEYQLSNVVDFMNLYINDPQKLTEIFTVTRKRLVNLSGHMLGLSPDNLRSRIYATQDYLQARILPNPKYFTDENMTGVKIFTVRPVDQSAEESYNTDIFNVIRDIFADFLATAKESDFKDGNYKLKSAFLEELSKTSNEPAPQ